MKISKTITPGIINAATALLEPYVEGITPRLLIEALKQYQQTATVPIEKPLTRQETAALLGVCLQTVSNYLRDGVLKKIPLTARSCRIDPASVRELTEGRR